jgi:hypothetical protein
MDTKRYIEELEKRCDALQEKVTIFENQIQLTAIVYSKEKEPKYAVVYAYVKFYKLPNTNGFRGANTKEVCLMVIHKIGKKWQILYGADYEHGQSVTDKRYTRTENITGSIYDAIRYGVTEAGYDKAAEIYEHSL